MMTSKRNTDVNVNVNLIPTKCSHVLGDPADYTVDSRYLDLAYFEQLLISKQKSGPFLNMKI